MAKKLSQSSSPQKQEEKQKQRTLMDKAIEAWPTNEWRKMYSIFFSFQLKSNVHKPDRISN